MTTIVLPTPRCIPTARELAEDLRNDPEIMAEVERGMKARLEGRVRSWSRVKKELGL
jgi:hypothetical protein